MIFFAPLRGRTKARAALQRIADRLAFVTLPTVFPRRTNKPAQGRCYPMVSLDVLIGTRDRQHPSKWHLVRAGNWLTLGPAPEAGEMYDPEMGTFFCIKFWSQEV
jgi:hypothetical protein